MAFEVKPDTGSLFRVPEKDKPEDRDYSGQANIGGELYWVSGWVKESKQGKKYLALKYKPQAERQTAPRRSLKEDLGDEISF
jgi:hypothetical protein